MSVSFYRITTWTSSANCEAEQSDKTFRPYVKPSDILGVFTESLDSRFDDMDESFRHKLLDVMKAEDSKLKTFIDKAQLEAWYRTTRDCAESTVANAYNQITKASETVETATNGNGSAKLLFTRRDDGSRTSLFGV